MLQDLLKYVLFPLRRIKGPFALEFCIWRERSYPGLKQLSFFYTKEQRIADQREIFTCNTVCLNLHHFLNPHFFPKPDIASAACPVAFSTPSCAALEALSIAAREGKKISKKLQKHNMVSYL